MILPIDLVPNVHPPRFKWKQIVTTPVGNQTVAHEGRLPPAVELAVMDLIRVAHRQELEITKLQETVLEMDTRIAEMTKERHETGTLPSAPIIVQPSEEGPVAGTIRPVTSSKKGKG